MDEKLLLDRNRQKSLKRLWLNKGFMTYKSDVKNFNGLVIQDILAFVNDLHSTYENVNIPISFEFENILIEDKLTYIFFEIICFVLIRDYKHSVYVKFNAERQIFTEGVESSPLLLLKTGEKKHLQKFVDKYSFDIFNNHYRRILSLADMKDEKLCKTMDEIRNFLKYTNVAEQYLDDISEVIIELIGNVGEHTGSDCLVDIDVTKPYQKKTEEGLFYGINLIVLNFSEHLFYEQIKKRILSPDAKLTGRYQNVKEAYDFHREYFDESYREEDFFNIAAFQHKISGSDSKQVTGGTGLTKLICSLEKRSDTHNCYLISGDRALWFNHELLEYNEDQWIGFNKEKDFISHLPEKNTVAPDGIFMPGAAYNLNFAIKEGSN